MSRWGVATILVGWLLAAGAAGTEVGSLSVTVKGGQLSVDADGVPLTKVLHEIARQARITVYFEKGGKPQSSDPEVRTKFDAMPLEDGLRRLLRDRNFVLVQSAAGLAEVWVYDREGTQEFARLGRNQRAAERAARRPVDGERRPRAEPEPVNSAELLQQIRAGGDPEERAEALEELAATADDAIVRDTAVEVLERESHQRLLDAALESLAGLETVPVDPLLAFLGRQRPAELRSRAIELLGEHGGRDPRVRQLLQGLARTERDEEVRDAARSALEDLTSQ
jgi:hypothetical protein